MVVILLSFIAFIRAREATTVDLQMKQADSMFDVAASAKDTITNYRLIADYFQRPAATERFLRRIRAYNEAAGASAACNTNNEYFPQWIAIATQCFWIIIGGLLMLERVLGLSSFLTTLAVFRTTGAEFQKIYLAYMKIRDAFAPLYRVVTYMNKPTEA